MIAMVIMIIIQEIKSERRERMQKENRKKIVEEKGDKPRKRRASIQTEKK